MECAFEKGVDALESYLEAVLVREFVGDSFPGFLGHSPLAYLVEMSP